MRLLAAAIFVSFATLVAAQTDSTTATTPAVGPVSTTPRTLAQQALITTGGPALLQQQDAVAQIEVTHPGSTDVSARTVKLTADGFRSDQSDSSSSVVSSGTTAQVVADGKTETYSQRAFGPEGLSIFPFLAIARDLNEPQVAIEVVSADATTTSFRVRRFLKPPFAKAREYEFSADATTGQITSVRFHRYAPGNEKFSVAVEFRFSNFQVTGGVIVPMTVMEYIRGNLAATIQVKSIVFNQGLSASDFTVPGVN